MASLSPFATHNFHAQENTPPDQFPWDFFSSCQWLCWPLCLCFTSTYTPQHILMVQFALNWPCRYPWMIFFASPCHPLLLPTHHHPVHPRHRALLNQMHPLASYPSSLFLLQYSHSASEPNEHRFLLIVSMNKSFYFDAKFSWIRFSSI